MTKTLQLYRWATKHLTSRLQKLVQKRAVKGKEDPARLQERFGVPSMQRPEGPLIWLHAASVGEAQSALILIEHLLQRLPTINILVTTGTVTSATLMQQKLPHRAFHQYYPLDHPDWVEAFLSHWRPDLAFWMESELWPNMFLALKHRRIPCVLVNARLSDKSYRRWTYFSKSAAQLLRAFSEILAQTQKDAERFEALGAENVSVTDNLKYSAKPLAADEHDLKILSGSLLGRTIWVYASTHAGEEEMACHIHAVLKNSYPDLLTIIIPRHPERRNEIKDICQAHGLSGIFRGEDKKLPTHDTDIYIADTLGELGLFYRLSPLACIGRSFSSDGGGGHNPLEAAQLNCAVLHGPHVQFQKEIFDDMHMAEAALEINDEAHFIQVLQDLFDRPEKLRALQENGLDFAQSKTGVIHRVMETLEPLLKQIEETD